MYYLLVIIFILDILIIYVDPIISKKRKDVFNNKVSASKIYVNEGKNLIEFETYPNKVLTNFKGENITIDAEYINIKEESTCNNLVLKNVKKILSFNVVAKSISFQNSRYKEENGVIYDDKDNACFILNKKRIKELISISQKNSISKSLLSKFSNSTYFQFVPSKGLLRISSPYYESDKKVRVVIPDRIDGINIETVEINCKNIEFIYIGKNVKKVILEQKILFDKIKIDKDNKYLKIRNGQLVYRVYNVFVEAYISTTHVKDSTKFAYMPKKSLSKKNEKCQMRLKM